MPATPAAFEPVRTRRSRPTWPVLQVPIGTCSSLESSLSVFLLLIRSPGNERRGDHADAGNQPVPPSYRGSTRTESLTLPARRITKLRSGIVQGILGR